MTRESTELLKIPELLGEKTWVFGLRKGLKLTSRTHRLFVWIRALDTLTFTIFVFTQLIDIYGKTESQTLITLPSAILEA